MSYTDETFIHELMILTCVCWFPQAEVVQQEVSSSTEVLQTTSVELKSGQSTGRDLELELQCPLSVVKWHSQHNRCRVPW